MRPLFYEQALTEVETMEGSKAYLSKRTIMIFLRRHVEEGWS